MNMTVNDGVDLSAVRYVALCARNGDDNFQKMSIDNTTGDFTVISREHHEVHEGSSFRYFDSVTLGSAGTQVYLITTPNTTKWAHFTFTIDGTAVTSFDIYEGADRTGTTLQTVFNANRNSIKTATIAVHKDISAGTTDGTVFIKYASGTASNQSRSSSSAEFNSEWILKQNTKYLIRITSGTAGNLCNIMLNWYEHTDH